MTAWFGIGATDRFINGVDLSLWRDVRSVIEEFSSTDPFGDGILVEPVRSTGWAEGWFEAIRIDDEAFARPEQGALPPAVGLSD